VQITFARHTASESLIGILNTHVYYEARKLGGVGVHGNEEQVVRVLRGLGLGKCVLGSCQS
jgi:hypothetical protein